MLGGEKKEKKKKSKNQFDESNSENSGELFLNWGTQSFYRVPNSGVNHCSSPPPSTLRGRFTLKLVFELHPASTSHRVRIVFVPYRCKYPYILLLLRRIQCLNPSILPPSPASFFLSITVNCGVRRMTVRYHDVGNLSSVYTPFATCSWSSRLSLFFIHNFQRYHFRPHYLE